MINLHITGEAAGMQTDAPAAAPAAAPAPAVASPAAAPSTAAASPATASPPAEQPSSAAVFPFVEEAAAPPALAPLPSKYRHEWLQMQKYVEVAVFAKKMTKQRVSITIGKQQLDIVILDAEVPC